MMNNRNIQSPGAAFPKRAQNWGVKLQAMKLAKHDRRSVIPVFTNARGKDSSHR